MSQPLRFGVLCHSTVWARWQVDVVRSLIDSGVGTCEVLVMDEHWQAPRRSRREGADIFAYRLWNRLMVKPKVPAWERVDSAAVVASAEVLRVRSIRKKQWSDYFSPEDTERVASHGLDFLLRFGFGILRGAILNVPRYGIWSYHHDDEREFRGSPPCFWSLYHGRPTSGAILQRLTKRLDGGIVLRRGLFQTGQTYAENVQRVYEGAQSWVLAEARRVQCGDTSRVEGQPSKSKAPIYKPPTSKEMLAFAARSALRRARSAGQRAFWYPRWNLAVSELSPRDFFQLDGDAAEVRAPRAAWAHNPDPQRYLADPFVFEQGGAHRVVCEDYSYRRGSGHLATLELRGARFGSEAVNHPTPWHVSYPFVLDEGGELLCAPESRAARRQAFFRIVDGRPEPVEPGERPEQPCLVDPTPFVHEGRQWLLGGLGASAQYELYAYYQDDEGRYVSHPLNPVKVTPRGARCAGPVIQVDGRLLRPAQDCTTAYGEALILCEITELSPTAYAEVEVRRVLPRPDDGHPDGLHHVSFFEHGAVFDGMKEHFSLLTPYWRVRNRLGRRLRSHDQG